MAKVKDLTGMKFGRLTVIKRGENYVSPSGWTQARWLCKCDCGNPELVLINSSALTNNRTKSCGCIQKEIMSKIGIKNTKHFGCMICGSDKHYSKGMCHTCYERTRRQKIRYKNERMKGECLC